MLTGQTTRSSIVMTKLMGGMTNVNPYYPRQPKNYHRSEVTKNLLGYAQTVVGKDLLVNTNETIHPAVRYRHYCANEGTLGTNDGGAYEPEVLAAWKAPSIQADGRIGAPSKSPESGAAPLAWQKPPADPAKDKTLFMEESELGIYDKLFLYLYDQDEGLKDRPSVWKQVLGDKTM